MVVDDSLQFASAVGQFLACNGNFHAVLDLLFATSNFNKESRAWHG